MAQGSHLWQLARGIDHRSVVPDRDAKSISHETTFAVDIDDDEVLRAWILELSDQVGRRLRAHDLQGGTVHLKVRFHDFRTITRSLRLANPTQLTQEICDAANLLLEQRVAEDHLPVRLVGIGVSQLDRGAAREQLLFEEPAHQRQTQLDAATDVIREKFGRDALTRGSRLLHDTTHHPPPKPDHNTQDPF